MYATFRNSDQPAKSVLVRKPALLAALLVFFSLVSASFHPVFAQSSTTGAVAGTVADGGGALLPGVDITVKSASTGVERSARSNASGEYRVSNLEPGVYTATFTADGFETYVTTSISVTVGSLTTVSPQMKVGATSNSVVVTDETPQMHTQSSDISSTLDQASIDNLPINGRRWSDFALLTPGVVSNSDGFGLLSFRGISFLLNNNTVDGADDNQAYFSEARGRTRAAYTITQVAVQEFQVNTSNYSAQYGRSAGGVINTVTKSGGNDFHGELFFYDRDLALGGATNPYTLLTVSNGSGGYNSIPYKPTDWRKQWGFGAGGPLLRKKLFWYYAYDQARRNFPGTGRAPDPNNTFAPSNATLPAGETCTATSFTTTSVTLSAEGDYNACAIAAALGTNFQAGSAYYQQGLSILSSFLGPVPRFLDQVVNLPKLDYQINDRNRLSLMYNRMRESSPNGFQTQASNFYGTASFGNDFVKEDFGIVRLSSILSNSILNDALVQYGRDLEYSYSDTPLPNELPLANNSYSRPADISIGYNFLSGFDIGKNQNLDRLANPDERRLQALDGLTWSHGKHTSKAGLEFNRVTDYVNNLYDGNGNYSFDYSYDFIADYLHATTGLGGSNYTNLYYSYGQAFGNPVGEIATSEYAGYATDDWRIWPRLTLTLGVRYEYEYIPPNPFPNTGNPALVAAFANNPTYASSIAQGSPLPQTSYKPDDRNNIAPRFGFSLDVYGKGKTILRGGYGMYFGRVINSNILQTYLDSGATNAQINLTSSGGNNTGLYAGHCGPSFPNLVTSLTDVYNCFAGNTNALAKPLATPTPPLTTVAYLDPHMQNPQVHEMDLALEQNLGHNTVFGLTYMGSYGRELPRAVDTNINTANASNFTFTVGPLASTVAGNTYAISATTTPSYVNYPQPPQTGYVTYPNGGMKLPFAAGQTFTTKVFLQPVGTTASTRPNVAYGQILDVRSDVNSSYNALAVQITHRYTEGFSLMANYTWSHSLDDNPYMSTVVPTYAALDPTNQNLEHGNSSLDVRQRFVLAAVYQPRTQFHGLMDKALGGWRIAPIVKLQTGLPFTPYVSGSASGLTVPNGVDGCAVAKGCAVNLAYKGLNGSGSSANRLPWIERNTYNRPKTAVVDARLGKNFYFNAPHLERLRLEFFAEMFNIMNHQNITGITNQAYSLSGTTLTPYATFGQYTNSNSNYTYSSRQMQIAVRLHF